MNNFLNEIKQIKWFLGIRARESLFFYSAKYLRIIEIVQKENWPNFIETLLVTVREDYPIRAFNLDSAKRFHQHSLERALKDPGLINKYIEEDENLWQKMLGSDQPDFQNLLNMYARHGALFIIIFSLGKVMAENPEKFESKLLKKHDEWRNAVAFKEEDLGNIFYQHFEKIKTDFDLQAKAREMMDYLSAGEILKLLNNKISAKEISRSVEQRKKQGYVFACLKSFCGTIDDEIAVNKTADFFKKMSQKQINKLAGDAIIGRPANISPKPVRGKVIIVRDKNELVDKGDQIQGNILVAVQTTPHFVPYLKNAKAIVTDEGGITCHAAIISRELGIPCVIGTKIATKALKDGDVVEVDATHGKVTIIEKS